MMMTIVDPTEEQYNLPSMAKLQACTKRNKQNNTIQYNTIQYTTASVVA